MQVPVSVGGIGEEFLELGAGEEHLTGKESDIGLGFPPQVNPPREFG
jgi:hypothetical protein